jgi:prepilin-type N-terminal cleavage/methylation domain-containing protein
MKHSFRPIRRTSASGFTLIEVLVVIAVFSILMLIATSIFLLSSQSSRRAATAQKLQGDVRFALEAIAREVRYGTIDYGCYEAGSTCDPQTGLPAQPTVANGGETSLLALRDLDGNRVRYKAMNDATGTMKLQVCFIDISEQDLLQCDAAHLSNWQVVTPEDVKIVSATFFLHPYQNPFQLKDPVPDSGSPYLANAQPRVTIVLKTQQASASLGSGVPKPENISSQTTVVSRFYAR